jgi:hypothetical protein
VAEAIAMQDSVNKGYCYAIVASVARPVTAQFFA